MDKNLYSIKIDKTGRYVKYCDDCWYETCEEEFRFFTKEEAEKIRKQMKNHYVYKVTISNGVDTLTEDSPVKKPTPVSKMTFSDGKGNSMSFGSLFKKTI